MPASLSKKLIGYSLVLGSYLFAFAAMAAEAGDATAWGYKGTTGPRWWGHLNPAYTLCATGKTQSPINILNTAKNTPNALQLHYSAAPLDLINDGPTTLTIGAQQTIVRNGHSVQVNFTPSANETIQFEGTRYHLVQFHLHTPSENELHGQAFPLEIHFVHQSDDGKVAVIGVFAKGGEAQTELAKIIKHLPKDKGKEHEIADEKINPAALMPAKLAYYRFMGSLTTPPCAEGLYWLVMQEPITVSPAQIATLKKAMGGSNARPVQLLNGREIRYAD